MSAAVLNINTEDCSDDSIRPQDVVLSFTVQILPVLAVSHLNNKGRLCVFYVKKSNIRHILGAIVVFLLFSWLSSMVHEIELDICTAGYYAPGILRKAWITRPDRVQRRGNLSIDNGHGELMFAIGHLKLDERPCSVVVKVKTVETTFELWI